MPRDLTPVQSRLAQIETAAQQQADAARAIAARAGHEPRAQKVIAEEAYTATFKAGVAIYERKA